ncbi:MAG: dephospho-CoA kinase [Deltaproteobacteria bacterium]|nr:dephospho-CoA kinase [Deltaproteobacteria bacterium]
MTVKTIIFTGNLCSGKSTAQNYFEKKGYECTDADRIVKHVILSNLRTVIRRFPEFKLLRFQARKSISNTDQKKIFANITDKVFRDRKLLLRWEKFVHKAVYKELNKNRLSSKNHKLRLLFIPLYFESHMRLKGTKVVLIFAKRELCLKRAFKKNVNFAKERLERQFDFEKTFPHVDFVVFNNHRKKDFLTALRMLEDILFKNID